MCRALNQGYRGECDMVPAARGFTVQMSAQVRTIHGDHSTEQGYPTLLIGVTRGRLSGGGTPTTTGDKRAEMSQVRGYEEHSLKTFQNNGESLGKCHLGTSLLSAALRAYISVLPWGTGWEAGPRAFPESCLSNKQLSRSHPTQSGISCPLFGLYYPISLLHWVISFLYRGMFLGPWGHFLPAYCLLPPLISFWVPGRAVGS